MKRTYSAVFVILLFSLLAACSPRSSASPPPATTNTVQVTTYPDPFAYCAAVGTVDAPDERYTGEKMPDAIIEGFKKAVDLENSTMPVDMFKKATVWRCMDSKVYACNFGANLPCVSKANTSKTPTQQMNDFCKANPNAEFIPMSETGHDTIYSWRCASQTAEVLDQIAEVDAAGYIANIWYPIEPNP